MNRVMIIATLAGALLAMPAPAQDPDPGATPPAEDTTPARDPSVLPAGTEERANEFDGVPGPAEAQPGDDAAPAPIANDPEPTDANEPPVENEPEG